ncbi:hypothetical protein BANRA_04954 [Escherichia coli]|nr:hypothetical protein BANRA_04954 [Escherichia coli]
MYSAATTRDQARIVFEDAKNMVRKARSTLGRLFDFNKLAIYQEQSASKFEPLSSDANNLDGLNIHCAIIDELHAHKTRDVWDVLETATGARLQSLLFGITTAGFNKEGICYEQRDYAIKVLRGYNSDVEGAVKTTPLRSFTRSMREMIRLMKRSGRKRILAWASVNAGMICVVWRKKRRSRSLRG